MYGKIKQPLAQESLSATIIASHLLLFLSLIQTLQHNACCSVAFTIAALVFIIIINQQSDIGQPRML
jgi:hypothetical protein